MLDGGCLCGTVRYALTEVASGLVHCHCSTCRKHHGAPFASFTEVVEHGIRWLSGEPSIGEFSSSASRSRRFCEHCGSVVPTRHGERLLVPAGNLTGDNSELERLGESEQLHQFVAAKAPWHVIDDAHPKHQKAAAGWSETGFDAERPTVPLLPLARGATFGSCLCCAVSFTVTGAPARWLQCHCSRCRRGRSAAHGSNAFYALAQFTWQSGRELVRTYSPPEAKRFAVSFCTLCGGGAPVEREGVPFVLVPAGLLDGDPGFRPEAHIHVASKAAWFHINDGLPQHAELPPRPQQSS